MSTYGQFCPVAKAMELLDERWTMLVVRELTLGSRHFNEIRRGVPRMSPTLLSKRLATLVRAGVVERWDDAGRVTYRLTEAGQELGPVVDALGAWGVRWIGELGEEDLDPHLLLWDMHRNLDVEAMPPGRTVLRFRFTDQPPSTRNWWLVATREEVDVCSDDPGFDVRVAFESSLGTMVRLWRGDRTWREVLRSGDLLLEGDDQSRRAVTGWLRLSPLAKVPRPAVAVGPGPPG